MGETDDRIAALERKLATTNHALYALIAWISQSANAPIRRDEAQQILRMFGDGDGD